VIDALILGHIFLCFVQVDAELAAAAEASVIDALILGHI
jgi:hypothetical protein